MMTNEQPKDTKPLTPDRKVSDEETGPKPELQRKVVSGDRNTRDPRRKAEHGKEPV